jgi:osmotically-inducible protein OsmY
MALMSRYLEEMRMIEARYDWRRMQRPLASILLCGMMAASLQGCVELAIGGAAVVGSMASSDRRTFGAQTEDKSIVFKASNRVPNITGQAGHVDINSFNRRVLLTGEVRDEEMRAAVEREVAAIEGVQSIVNEVEVTAVASVRSRANDSLITSKVKASFVDTKDLYANSVKVVTERGTVYLMGRVSQHEGRLAGEVARGVSGVQKVVKVFDYIQENEVRQVNRAPEDDPSQQIEQTQPPK